MQTVTRGKAEQTLKIAESSYRFKQLSKTWRSAVQRLAERLTVTGTQDRKWGPQLIQPLLCVVIFLVAFGVRVLSWQDSRSELTQYDIGFTPMDEQYKIEAQRMLDEGGYVFPREHSDSGDAKMLVHPPGYPMLLALMYGKNLRHHLFYKIRWIQLICDSISAAIVLLIAAKLFPLAIAFIASTLVALSPHLAYYSRWGTPDTLTVLPILIAVYLIVRARTRPQLITILAAGAMVGLSCWLRANGLLLALPLAAAVWFLFERIKRVRYSLALVAATLMVIAPITIRNWVVFGTFVPLSIDSGVAMIEGIGNYDKEGRFGMPERQRALLHQEVEMYGRPNYPIKLWRPDGIKRDRERFTRGLAVVAKHPVWFFGVMLRRAGFMLSYNSSRPKEWPENTATVPLLSARPAFNHAQNITDVMRPAWSAAPQELMAAGETTSQEAEVSLTAEGDMLRITGDCSDFRDQFASAPIAVKKNTDYLLVIPFKMEQGRMAIKVTSPDRRVVLGSAVISEERADLQEDQAEKDVANESREVPPESRSEQQTRTIRVPFASGASNDVRLCISSDGAGAGRCGLKAGRVEIFTLGPTPFAWTLYPRTLIRGIQRNLYTTATMLTLVIAGIVLLVLGRRHQPLLILLAVPIYYVCAHSVLHTEYRYILAIHYFLFVMAAVTLFCAGLLIKQATRSVYKLTLKRI